jgi:CHAT domain-containing protein/tetratricopeptide (TPR) repeat protein
MRAAFRRRSVPVTRGLLTWIGASAVCTVLVLTDALAPADPPPASKVARLSEADRKKLLAERDRYDKQSTDLEAQRKYAEAIAAAEKMLAIERRVFGDVAEDVAGSLERIGRWHLERDEFALARKAFEERLSIKLKLYGERDWRVTNARQDLLTVDAQARLSPEQRRELVEAEGTMSQVVAFDRKEEFAKAIPFATRALEIRLRLLGPERPETATSCVSLGHLYLSAGKYLEAEPYYRRALAIREKVLGDEHPDTRDARGRLANSLSWIADLQTQQENFAPAQMARKEALALQIKQYGEQDWRVTDARQALRDVDIRSHLTVAERRELISAEQANAQAVALYGKRDFRQAIRFAEQAVNKRRRLLGDQHPDTATSLGNLALMYESLGDYAKAEPLYRQAPEIDKRALGETHPKYATDLNNLALLYEALGDYTKAEPLLLQALEINKKVLGENHRETATNLNNLAALYKSLGDYAKAEPLLRQALEITKKVLGEKQPEYATNLNNLASLYKSRGDYAKAEPLFRQALEIHKTALGEKHPRTALSLNNLALLYRSMGDDTKAEPLLRRALEIRKKVLGEKHPDTAASLSNLAQLYKSLGDYAKAEPLYRQALEINQQALGEKHSRTAVSLSNLAELYQLRGDYAKAEPLRLQALEINKKVLGENHPATATDLNNLAMLYKSLGDYAKAEPLYRQALEISKKALGENHPDTATSLNNLALLYEALGDYAKAEPLCRQALEISLGGLSHNFGILSERQQLALESDSLGALSNYLSLASAAGIGDGAVYAYVLESKGAVTARQSLVRLERRRPNLKPLFDELQTVGTRLSNLSLAGPDPKHPELRLQKIEALTEQKELLEGKLSGQYHEFAQTRDAARLGREEQLKKLQAAIPPQIALVDVLEYWYVVPPSAKKEPQKFERRLVAFVVRSAAFVRKIDLGPVAPIAKLVDSWRHTYGRPGASDPGTALRARIWKRLEPALAGAETILFSPDGPLCRFPLAALPGSKPDSYLIEERNIVVIPVPQLLASAGPQSAEGSASTPLLIGDVDFGSEPGIVSLAQSDVGPAVERSRSAVRGEANLVFSPLPGTAREIEGISSLYRQQFAGREPQSISGSKATEQAFRTEAARHRWIHVATHGFFAPETVPSALNRATGDKQPAVALLSETANNVREIQPGLLSGIALAGANRKSGPDNGPAPGANQEPDDGIMTALEVEGLDLADVDLVVLSACETGLGQSAGGEGVLGLQRAFQLAGAKTCVTSLWKVDDTATQVLMQEFYGNLWGIDPTTKKPRKKLSKLEALKQAQLKMLRDYDPGQKKLRGLDLSTDTANGPERGSPFYWAAFVLSGDWR